jgi:hypothetical protein
MQRKSFLSLLASGSLLGSVSAASEEIELPVELRGGRFFALPRVYGGRTFACWLDTDGSGFVFASAVRRFNLSTRTGGGETLARLPHFDPGRAVPPLVRNGGELRVFDVRAADAADPIFQGFDAQLGGSWFADRVWRLDFARASMSLRLSPLPAGEANVPLTFDRIYPRTTAEIAGESLPMSIDIAASLAKGGSQSVVATSFVRRDVFERWRAAHPQWQTDVNVSTVSGIDRIVVPALRAGNAVFNDVAFTTRPGDDVFAGSDVAGKLGANAYADRVVTIDYPNARLRVTP